MRYFCVICVIIACAKCRGVLQRNLPSGNGNANEHVFLSYALPAPLGPVSIMKAFRHVKRLDSTGGADVVAVSGAPVLSSSRAKLVRVED